MNHFKFMKSIKTMKKLLIKTTSFISLLSLGFLSTKPAIADTQYGENSLRPESLKVTFYEVGLASNDLVDRFSVLDSPSGVEADIADENSVKDLVKGIKANAGTYTHFYAVISNTYKVKGASKGCYTKAGNYNLTDRVFNFNEYTENGVEIPCSACQHDAWSAASSNAGSFGEAAITELAYGVDNSGQPDFKGAYGPASPSTSISVGGIEVKSMNMYLTNSSNPYDFIDDTTPVNQLPAASTRNRVLYIGELAQSVTVEEGSAGTVQLYFDFSKGIAFDDDCDSFKFNSNNFDMSVITE